MSAVLSLPSDVCSPCSRRCPTPSPPQVMSMDGSVDDVRGFPRSNSAPPNALRAEALTPTHDLHARHRRLDQLRYDSTFVVLPVALLLLFPTHTYPPPNPQPPLTPSLLTYSGKLPKAQAGAAAGMVGDEDGHTFKRSKSDRVRRARPTISPSPSQDDFTRTSSEHAVPLKQSILRLDEVSPQQSRLALLPVPKDSQTDLSSSDRGSTPTLTATTAAAPKILASDSFRRTQKTSSASLDTSPPRTVPAASSRTSIEVSPAGSRAQEKVQGTNKLTSLPPPPPPPPSPPPSR